MNNRSAKRSIGSQGEETACRYIQQKGFVIIQRNFTCRLGEIDIIARKDNQLIFIEVKTLRSSGDALLAIDRSKQNKLMKLATYYMETRNIQTDARFDAIGVNFGPSGFRVEHIENAFVML